jgi:hypothetical protein
MPDHGSNPGHFLPVFETSLTDEDSNQSRLPDDWQPRVQISKAFEEGKLALDDQPAIESFAKRIGIGEELVNLRHCQELQTLADIRARERTCEATKEKSCDSYDWSSLVLSGNVSNLKVYKLDKYLENSV